LIQQSSTVINIVEGFIHTNEELITPLTNEELEDGKEIELYNEPFKVYLTNTRTSPSKKPTQKNQVE